MRPATNGCLLSNRDKGLQQWLLFFLSLSDKDKLRVQRLEFKKVNL